MPGEDMDPEDTFFPPAILSFERSVEEPTDNLSQKNEQERVG